MSHGSCRSRQRSCISTISTPRKGNGYRQLLSRTYILLSTTAQTWAPHRTHIEHTSSMSGSTAFMTLLRRTHSSSLTCWALHACCTIHIWYPYKCFTSCPGSRFLVFLARSTHLTMTEAFPVRPLAFLLLW